MTGSKNFTKILWKGEIDIFEEEEARERERERVVKRRRWYIGKNETL